ncbi:MAG: nuclear transport factor 2 family protein [Armatimonadetes bacterium]|nr:nuclear transport factor 2 family protein [Armatimonadota bacterium]
MQIIATENEIIEVTRTILEAIQNGDSQKYADLCDPSLTAFETDVGPHRIDGVDFHRDTINAMHASAAHRTLVHYEILHPLVHLFSDGAIIVYTRLMTYQTNDRIEFQAWNETRAYRKLKDGWKMIHFHRSSAD